MDEAIDEDIEDALAEWFKPTLTLFTVGTLGDTLAILCRFRSIFLKRWSLETFGTGELLCRNCPSLGKKLLMKPYLGGCEKLGGGDGFCVGANTNRGYWWKKCDGGTIVGNWLLVIVCDGCRLFQLKHKN